MTRDEAERRAAELLHAIHDMGWYKLAAVAAALLAAAAEERAACIRDVCPWCKEGKEPKANADGQWWHVLGGLVPVICYCDAIRRRAGEGS